MYEIQYQPNIQRFKVSDTRLYVLVYTYIWRIFFMAHNASWIYVQIVIFRFHKSHKVFVSWMYRKLLYFAALHHGKGWKFSTMLF
jgi:hypothetical protein